jgi:hypothetical protein
MTDKIFLPRKQSILDLPIGGSVGTFSIRSNNSHSGSILVRFIQTHIGFAVTGDAEERLLQQLAPIREVFNVSELGFDELMQRDIDDARVSTELIPYLLEDRGTALVKLFPPIIVVVLPIDSQGRPAAKYPKVEEFERVSEEDTNVRWLHVRSGEVGSEVFEFKQLKVEGQNPDSHNYASLSLNTTGCRLAIVDGQHRAMALLALYRNWKQWPEKSRRYQEYYKRWDSKTISEYDLTQVRLPIMLCTFPDLNVEDTKYNLSVSEACRAVFLALNKNARPVTRARNCLLNDGDVIAHFLRSVLSKIKELKATSAQSIRLWNIELEGEGDKRALTSPMAITGVMHLYTTIEFLMLNSKWYGQLSAPRQNLWNRNDLSDCIRRLGAASELGADRCDRANRKMIERDAAVVLCRRFSALYGKVILKTLDEFRPYRIHSNESLSLETKLANEPNGATYHSILFEGQGIGRVFEEYVSRLREESEELKGTFGTVPPALAESFRDFEQKSAALRTEIETFLSQRTEKLFSRLSAKKARDIDQSVRSIYRETLTTEAFQSALLITFLSATETIRDTTEANGGELGIGEIEAFFDEYLQQLNKFFTPETEKEAWDIIRVFHGEVKPVADGHVEVARSSTCLKKLLIPGELKPEEWPKFRYILLELWQPSNTQLKDQVAESRLQLRLQVLSGLIDRELDILAKKQGVRVNDLEKQLVSSVTQEAKVTFCHALKSLGINLRAEDLPDAPSKIEAPDSESAEDLPDLDGA